jgi:NO-binding membrane sensor protein with MHYT domain
MCDASDGGRGSIHGMPVVHQFAYGALNPVAGFLLACIGSLIGLGAAAQARETRDRGRRFRWLVIASIAIGTGIWLMHFMAMLGFDVPDAPLRYDPLVTGFSAVLAILVVSIGIFIAGYGSRSGARILAGGLFTGGGVAAMHYTGMAAMRLAGTIGYDASLVAASVLVAVIAATVALWFTVTVDGRWPRVYAALVMGVAVTGMHYTGMGALRVHLQTDAGPVGGINPILLVLPITVIAAAALIGLVFTALQASAQEDFEPAEPARLVPPPRITAAVHMGHLAPPRADPSLADPSGVVRLSRGR